MFRKILSLSVSLLFVGSLLTSATTTPSSTDLSAADIVNRNVSARGGLQAWRAVQTISFAGKMGVGGNKRPTLAVPSAGAVGEVVPARPTDEVQLPFVMDLKRTRKMRLELQFNGQTALQVFDGTSGWKVRPFLNRRDVEPFSPEELKSSSMQADLDGPLMDYAAKGTQVSLEGVEKVDGLDNYKLKLTMKDGRAIRVWIDAQTFLETKIEGQPRRLDGVMHPVEIYYRNYHPVDGLQIPYVLETKVLPAPQAAPGHHDPLVPAEKIVIEKVSINPRLDDALFAKPQEVPLGSRALGAKTGR